MSAHQSLVVLARGGYAARGVIYLIIGIFALLAAQDSTKPKDSHRSLEALLSQPFGYVLVGLVVAGLLAFAAWRVLQAVRDVDHHGSNFKGLVIRAGLLAGGLVNGALAFFALGLLVSGLKSSGGDGGSQTKDLLAQMLSWEHSNLLIYLIALIPFGVGIAHLIKGWKATFEKYFEADEDVMRYVRPVSRFGLIARGGVPRNGCFVGDQRFQLQGHGPTGHEGRPRCLAELTGRRCAVDGDGPGVDRVLGLQLCRSCMAQDQHGRAWSGRQIGLAIR